jgi:hypothetical protein
MVNIWLQLPVLIAVNAGCLQAPVGPNAAQRVALCRSGIMLRDHLLYF